MPFQHPLHNTYDSNMAQRTDLRREGTINVTLILPNKIQNVISRLELQLTAEHERCIHDSYRHGLWHGHRSRTASTSGILRRGTPFDGMDNDDRAI